jgi:parallel beta-helix repeat protein
MKSTIHDESVSGMHLALLLIGLVATWSAALAGAGEIRPAPAGTAAGPSRSHDRPMRVYQGRTITVGQTEGDLQGKDDKIIQAAVDYVARFGGGTVSIGPGTYELRNAIYLRPHVTLQGSGPATILRKAPSFSTRLAQDADFCEWGVRVRDANGFHPGDGILVRARTGKEDWEYDVLTASITRIEGNALYLDEMVRDNFRLDHDAAAASVFPLITAEKVDDGEVKDLILEGNREHNEYIHGNFSGAVFLVECNRWRFTDVVARNYNGDGFSYQICDDVVFQDCQALHNTNYGFHPGSGAQRTVIRHCTAANNGLGIYACWEISDAVIEDCTLSENMDYGLSLGYRDTDNTIRRCTIRRNGKAGIFFRNEGTSLRCSARDQVIGCTIADNGQGDSGVGIDIEGLTHDVTIADCRLINTARGEQVTGIRIDRPAQRIVLKDDTFEGCRVQVDDRR